MVNFFSHLESVTCALWSLFSLSSLPLSITFVSSSASCFLRFSLLSSSSSSLKNSRWFTMGTLTTTRKRQIPERLLEKVEEKFRGRACSQRIRNISLHIHLSTGRLITALIDDQANTHLKHSHACSQHQELCILLSIGSALWGCWTGFL